MTSIVRHKKHANLEKPLLGHFARNEVAILGAPCPIIQDLALKVADEFRDDLNVTFIDADHKIDDSKVRFPGNLYTDKISHHRMDLFERANEYDQKLELMDRSLVLVNGNHFKASSQIIILNSKKKESLSRKLDRLTNVKLILTDDVAEIYDFLQDHIKDLDSIPLRGISDIDSIIKAIKEIVRIPPIYGLILAGGDSRRMGKDKTLLSYHGKGQSNHMFDVINAHVERTFISCKSGQEGKFPFAEDFIFDTFTGLGPFGAILSSFRAHPNAAWLVVASDQPLLGKPHIERLIQERNTSKIATCFYNPETKFPEPLITLWEPTSYQRMLRFLSLGYSCPRKVLINSDIELIKEDDTAFMKNANTPEEYDQLLSTLTSATS